MTREPFYIGTYTAESGGHGRGVYLALRDRETGRLDVQGVAAELPSPTFLASHPVLPVLYVTSEAEGTVSAYRQNEPGDLELLNAEPTGGELPCHVSVHPTGLILFVANYGDGTFSAHGLAPDGRLRGQSQLVRHAGGGQDPVRQDGPHVHCTLPTPDGRYVLVTDLGADTVSSYPCDAASGALDQRAACVAATGPGAGPRHLAFEPVSGLLYVSCELNSTVAVYALAQGCLRWLRSRPATARVPAGINFPSELLLGPGGRTLFVGNRGADAISAFAVGPAELRPLGNLPAGGQYPRHIALAGQHLYAGNQHSDSISIFTIGPDGMARLPGELVAMPSPACLFPSSIK